MSISTSDRSSVSLDEVDRVLAGGGADHLHAVPLEQAVEREDVADVVVHHQHFAALQRLVALVQGLDHLLLGRAAGPRSRGAGTAPSHRAAAPASARPSARCSSPSCAARPLRHSVSSRPVKTTIGVSRSFGSCWISVSSSKPEISGSRRSSTTQSKARSRMVCERFRAGAGAA